MAKFSLNDILNSQSLSQKKPIFEIKHIPILKIRPSADNIYGMREIEELAANIEMLGLMHNLDVRDADENGMYEIISGERRYQACKLLYESGNRDFEMIPCKVESAAESKTISELKLLYANAAARELTDYEKTYQAGRIRELLAQMKKDGYEFRGRMREIVAEMLHVSPAQVGRMEKIHKNLSPEFQEEYKAGKIGITQAYELSGQTKEQQAETFHDYRKEGAAAIKPKPRPKAAQDFGERTIFLNDGFSSACIFTRNIEQLIPIDPTQLCWNEDSERGKYLTLNQIRDQVRALEDCPSVLYVWEESGLSGNIYQTGNNPEKDVWEKHGTTKGYA